MRRPSAPHSVVAPAAFRLQVTLIIDQTIDAIATSSSPLQVTLIIDQTIDTIVTSSSPLAVSKAISALSLQVTLITTSYTYYYY